MIKTAILTVSTSRNKKDDESGKEIAKLLDKKIFKVASYLLVKDDSGKIREALIYFSDTLECDLVLTNGGTGLSPADVTPEATLAASERIVPGIPEIMRSEGMKKNHRAALSRGVSVIRGKTLIVNLPGSPAGVKESLSALLDVLPHAIDMLGGKPH